MAEFLQNFSLFPVLLTLASFQVGQWCRKKTGSALFNPLLIAVLITIAVLLLIDMEAQVYIAGNQGINWLLTPATVCLAVPLYEQMKVLKGNLAAIFAGIFSGTVTSLLCIFVLCKLFGLDQTLTVSLLPKSVTTAIGLVLAEGGGGIPSLTAAAIMITGILGNLTGTGLCKLLKITDPIALGVGFGTASHAIGTAKANELDPLTGAVSSLSLAVAGVLTAVLFPLALIFL